MGLRVIGAGLGRTGTASLKAALEELLGGRCYHMFEVRNRPADPDVWGDAYEGKFPDWHAFFEGYEAAVDWPVAPFWRELSEAFPDAPIILSVRDADSWWESASSTIFHGIATMIRPEASDGWARMGRGMVRRFTPAFQDEGAAKQAYLAYNDHVRATAPPERLVEWSAADGWAPICAALGLNVPDHPFPHVNTRTEIRAELGLDALEQ